MQREDALDPWPNDTLRTGRGRVRAVIPITTPSDLNAFLSLHAIHVHANRIAHFIAADRPAAFSRPVNGVMP